MGMKLNQLYLGATCSYVMQRFVGAIPCGCPCLKWLPLFEVFPFKYSSAAIGIGFLNEHQVSRDILQQEILFSTFDVIKLVLRVQLMLVN